MIEFTPVKSKKIALARLDLLNQWKEFRRKSENKLQADYDFVNLHNTSNSHLFQVLGKISRGSLHRWNTILNGTEDYTNLIPQTIKVANLNEMKVICSLLTYIHQEINDYEQLLNMTSIQYANQLFKDNKEFEKNIKFNLATYTAKLETYRSVAKELTNILAKKGH